MTQYLILIPTFNRALMLRQILDRIQGDYHAVIMNDGSTRDPAVYAEISHRPNVTMLFQPTNRGKTGFWMTLSALYDQARRYQFRYVVMVPDDAMPCDNFLPRIAAAFEQEKKKDPWVCAMNILPTLPMNWETDRYIDNCFVADRRYMQVLGWTVGPCKAGPTGSGTGKKITRKIAASPCRIAPVREVSYLELLDVESVMLPDDPRPRGWWQKNFIF